MQAHQRNHAGFQANTNGQRRPRWITPCRHCGAEYGNTPPDLRPCPDRQCPAQLCGSACLRRHQQQAQPERQPEAPLPAFKNITPRRRRVK